jgi:AraC family transcriptional regulator
VFRYGQQYTAIWPREGTLGASSFPGSSVRGLAAGAIRASPAYSKLVLQLDSGQFFGRTSLWSSVGLASVALTHYERQEQPWHCHPNHTFFVHLRGDHRDSLARVQFEQPILSIVYHPAGVVHRSSIGSEGMSGLNIEVTAEWLDAHRSPDKNLGKRCLITDPEASCLSLSLLHASAANGHDAESLLTEFVAVAGEDTDREETPQWVRNVITFADESCAEKITVRQIADRFSVHPVYLARAFRKATGGSLSDRLQKGRLKLATSLLLQGVSAGEAAVEAGFGDQFYMSRCFRKHFGVAPTDFKRLRLLIAG